MAGFKANVYSQIGASNHVADPRQDDDFYATDPAAVEVLVKKLQELKIAVPPTIIETSVGAGHIAHVFERYGREVEPIQFAFDNEGMSSILASILGIASRQVFKYKLDHDSFTRLELRALRSALLLSDEEFLVLMDLEK